MVLGLDLSLSYGNKKYPYLLAKVVRDDGVILICLAKK